MTDTNENWDLVIKPRNSWLDLRLREIWQYRDLLALLVRRDFVSVYKQTILGPLWFFLQPILTTTTFTIIFSLLARIETDEIPPVLFYMSGIVFWNYFANCLTSTSNTFISNAAVFGKVYFPRLVVPISIVISNLLKFSLQFILFIIVWIFYINTTDVVHPNWAIALLPLLIIIMAGIGMGLGIILSSLTVRYRDLSFLIGFGVQLLMYMTPVIYPLSLVPDKYKYIVMMNPMVSIMEAIKYGFLGTGMLDWGGLAYSAGFMLVVLLAGISLFNRVERSFMDTV